jgi:hypothetical protein|tara:strand:- start:4015 stop:4314 length:300 start_codon:yes stop_codon:yes gene_type:complete
MQVGVLRIRFRLPGNTSLKGKRQVVKPIIARIGNKFNVAVAETGDTDLWQMATIGVCYVSNDKRHVNEVLSKIADFINNSHFEIEMLDHKMEILPFFGD